MANVKFCPECGAKILETQKFCAECGYNFENFEKTVGVFPDATKKEGEGTIGIFETKKELGKKEKSKKVKKAGTPFYKKWYVWVIAAVIVVVGLITAFGGWGIVSDVAMYDENDTSDRIVLDREVPDPLTLSYYDYMMTNCPENKMEIWETVDSVQNYKSAYQKNVEDITDPYIEIPFEFTTGSKGVTEEQFNSTVRILKDRLDTLEAPYAIKYAKNSIGTPMIYVRTGLERMGQPVIEMLTYNSNPDALGSGTGGDYNTYLVSQMGEYKLNYATEFSFKKKLDGEYDMFLSLKNEKIREEDIEEYNEFLKSHDGESLYWVLDGEITVAGIPITKDILDGKDIKFTELSFLNNRKPKWEESFLLKLLYTTLKGEQYPVGIMMYGSSVTMSEGASISSLGYHIFTAVDESMKNTISSLHNEVYVYRGLGVNSNCLEIEMIYANGSYNHMNFANTVKQLYQSNSAISGGAYSDLKITAYEKNADNPELSSAALGLWFDKTSDGKIEMSPLYYSSHPETDEIKNFFETDSVFSSILERD